MQLSPNTAALLDESIFPQKTLQFRLYSLGTTLLAHTGQDGTGRDGTGQGEHLA